MLAVMFIGRHPANAPHADPPEFGALDHPMLHRIPTRRAFCYLLGLAVAGLGRTAAAAELSGEQIFTTKCAACHGPHGEGTKKHRPPLAGDKSLAQLLDVIGREMPEDDPGTLSKHDTEAVANYVYTAMYSPTAQQRNRPARIELARLTVGQYRQAVADLIGSFRYPAKWDGSLGLKAEYIAGRDRKSKDNKGGKGGLERVDPQVNFDFGADSPDPDKIDAHKFSIHWNGSLLAPRTGDYDFVVRTDHACRLWINDMQHPLIDAWVKSGNDTEYRGTLYLVGGRVYPLRLEFSKSKQGVDDSKKKDKKEEPPAKAFIKLCWVPPLGVDEPIPSRNLSPKLSAGAVCLLDAVSARRPELRLGAGHDGVEGMGRSDDRGSHRHGRLCDDAPRRSGRHARRRGGPRREAAQSSAANSPNGRSAALCRPTTRNWSSIGNSRWSRTPTWQ